MFTQVDGGGITVPLFELEGQSPNMNNEVSTKRLRKMGLPLHIEVQFSVQL